MPKKENIYSEYSHADVSLQYSGIAFQLPRMSSTEYMYLIDAVMQTRASPLDVNIVSQ